MKYKKGLCNFFYYYFIDAKLEQSTLVHFNFEHLSSVGHQNSDSLLITGSGFGIFNAFFVEKSPHVISGQLIEQSPTLGHDCGLQCHLEDAKKEAIFFANFSSLEVGKFNFGIIPSIRS